MFARGVGILTEVTTVPLEIVLRGKAFMLKEAVTLPAEAFTIEKY
jgi:hypothetical protein